MRSLFFVLSCPAIAIILVGCGGGGGSSSHPPPQITATLSPGSLNFGIIVIETTSVAQSLTLTNNSGTTSLSITSITASGSFSQMNNCFGTLSPNTLCTVNLTSSPTSTGTATGSITVVDNASNSPQTATLSGTGTAGYISTGSMNTGRYDHTATLLDNGMVLIAAGSTTNGLPSAEVYDSAKGTFTVTGNLPTFFYTQTTTLLDNGKVRTRGRP